MALPEANPSEESWESLEFNPWYKAFFYPSRPVASSTEKQIQEEAREEQPIQHEVWRLPSTQVPTAPIPPRYYPPRSRSGGSFCGFAPPPCNWMGW